MKNAENLHMKNEAFPIKKDQEFLHEISKCIDYFSNNGSFDEKNEEIPEKPENYKENRKYCNSFHEFGTVKSEISSVITPNSLNSLIKMKKTEKMLINEINCYRAKEAEYIKKISFFDIKLAKMVKFLKEKKKKTEFLKCKFFKEQIAKENALSLIHNILEKYLFLHYFFIEMP